MNEYHISVLLQEAIEALRIESGEKYIDATLGGGGHSFEIVKRGGIVLGIDVDEDAIKYVKQILREKDIRILSKKEDTSHNLIVSQYPNILLAKGNFKDIDKLAKENGFEKAKGILFDLGVSSHQFDEGQRGFSFRTNAKLDMRMDTNLAVTAADLVNVLTKGELYELFTKLGEEHFARAISDNITRAREIKRIETTEELARIAERSYPKGFKKIHPATKIFQALRIAVNDEMHSLQDALPKAVALLDTGGRLIVISFQSLEDRIIKNYFKEAEAGGLGKIITEKPIIPNEAETESNKRARSAKLRIFERI